MLSYFLSISCSFIVLVPPDYKYLSLFYVLLGYAAVRVPIFPIVVCVRSAYVIGAGVGFRVESGAVALLQLDL